MALNTRDLLKPQTVLQQLLEEINFQRAKEMRHLLKDDGGFVVLQGTTYWTDLFVRHFLFQSANESIIDSDDLLFFVRKKHVRGSSRNMPKYDIDVDVFRKDSKKLPIGDPDVDWEETVYLNLVIHQFDYKLTLAICTRTSPKELQVLRRHTQRVYASPSRRKMDTKGESEEMTFPHICFMVDNFDEVFSDIMVRDGEMVCVELVASDKDGSVQGVIFLGSIRYDALKKVYDARQSSLGSKVAQRMTFGLFAGGQQTRCEFVRMKGPQGKGHAEMAVTKPKGSGVETPTSEPGFSATEMWDEWDEDPDDFFNYKHQRRLSDPCSNINNFSRFAFRSRGGGMNDTAQSKARSENEGLDALGNEISEIEAGDLRDDCPASSTPSKTVKDSSTTCCCFNKTRHSSIYGSDEMSDMYSRPIDDMSSPACLADVPLSYCKQKSMNLLNVESEIELSHTKDMAAKKTKTDLKSHETVLNNNKKIDDDFEVGDDAIDALTDSNIIEFNSDRVRYRNDPTDGLLVRVRGKEELPAKESLNAVNLPKEIDLNTNTVTTVKSPTSITDKNENQCKFIKNKSDLLNGNKTVKLTRLQRRRWQYCTLPRKAKPSIQCHRGPIELGHRRTPDGTDIYYWCDLPKKIFKELDDGAYNPLWATRGFTQTFHFWKENKRQQSTPLNAFLTYVTLPWWSIAKDLLDNREMPILTF